jgi:hypothetical protein
VSQFNLLKNMSYLLYPKNGLFLFYALEGIRPKRNNYFIWFTPQVNSDSKSVLILNSFSLFRNNHFNITQTIIIFWVKLILIFLNVILLTKNIIVRSHFLFFLQIVRSHLRTVDFKIKMVFISH